jgi:P4 family phage/plasmid primase-like protien
MKKFYTRKATPLKLSIDQNKLLCNKGITSYFLCDAYQQFLDNIKSTTAPDYYEYISANIPAPPFFDIEIYKETSPLFEDFHPVLDACINRTQQYVTSKHPESTMTRIILESHSDQKRSFHVILRFKDSDDKAIFFGSVEDLKHLYADLKLDEFKDSNNKNLVDKSVYREGLFRTLYSSKTGQARPLIKSELSDDFEELESFVGFKTEGEYSIIQTFETVDTQTLDTSTVNVPEDLSQENISTIKTFVQREFHHDPNRIRDVLVDKQHNCIVVALDERYCPFVDRKHKSNNGYIVIDTTSAKQKCHDSDCKQHKHSEITLDSYPKEIHEIIKKCLKVNQQELELIDNAIIECKNYITENFDNEIKDVSFDRTAMIFRGNVADRSLAKILKGKCPECNVEHQISDTGYCLKCTKCTTIFPKNQIIPVDQKYKVLNDFWSYYQIGTINNIINIYNNGEEYFSCDVHLDPSIIKDKNILKIVNECLDGHKITKMAELMHNIHKDYIFTGNEWFMFNGHKWTVDNKSIMFKRDILELTTTFNKIKKFYETKNVDDKAMTIIKNIKSLIIKINKPQLKDEILKDAQLFYMDSTFYSKLNSKNHLVPFSNGVYDLLENIFRKTKKEDYVNLTVGFQYNEAADNSEVQEFIDKILPNKNIQDYVLKKLSDCLNGDIPNTNFLMFIGDGANGKSQLLNLMKVTMGELGEKVEVTLLTRKRNNANEANTEKIKLMNKRFAFLSEPDDGEKINIGLLKELTGSEEIVARGLYQDSVSFVMGAKLFLACNELPEIKGEDTALWRRIRVVDFPSRFVDEPKESNEFKIDRTLPSRMREDVTWRQTFMKILLEYYNKDIREPREVQVKTNEYRQENNDFSNWLEENIVEKAGGFLQVKDICESYLGRQRIHSKDSTKYRKEIEKWIKDKFSSCIKWEYGNIKLNDKVLKGWKDLEIKDM